MGLVRPVRRFEIFLVNLDPALGSEIRRTRPCVVVSPDEMNRHIRTVIIAPMTTASRPYPTRVPIAVRGKEGQVALDQTRTVDKSRLVRRHAAADQATRRAIMETLLRMFAPDQRARECPPRYHAIVSIGVKGSSMPKPPGPNTASASGVRMIGGTATAITLTRWP